jgi:uncharacterized protein
VLFDTIFRYRTSILVLASITTVAWGVGILKLEVTTDNRIFYGPQNAYHLDFLEFEAQFTPNDNILFVVQGPYPATKKDYPEAIRWLTERALSLRHVIRVDSLATYPHPTSDDGELVVQPLLDWACSESGCTRDLMTEAAKSHLINRLISPDGQSTGVIATVVVERGAVGEIEALYKEVVALASEFEARFPALAVFYTGGIPMMAAFADASAADLGVILPLALLTVSILLVFVVGSLKLGGIILLVGISTIVVTLGFAGWLGLTLNNATTIVPLVVFTLVVTSSMHIAVHFSRNLGPRLSEDESVTQAKASLTSSITPVVLSAGTSIVSLCSLWLVDSPPIRQLGLLSALGVAIGCMFTLTVLPLLIARIRSVNETRLAGWLQLSLNSYAKAFELRKTHVTAPSVAFVLAAFGIVFLSINDDFVKFFDESTEFRQNTDTATRLLTGPNHIEVLLESPDGTVFQSDFLSYLGELSGFLRALPKVKNVHSFADVMSDVAQAFSDNDVAPDASSDYLAQLFLVYELSLQLGQSNTDLINTQQNIARASVLLAETTSSDIQMLERAIYAWHATNQSDFLLIVTGENIPVAHLSRMNITSMLGGIIGSLAFTAILLGTVFRSYRLSAVALLGTLAPVAAGFGIWGWTVGEIGLAATAIIALTIGVVVDDAAHFIYRFLDAKRRLGLDSRPAAAYSIHRVGTAIVCSSLVLALGLSLLLLSTFEVNSTFGAIACLIIGTALAFGLFILPSLSIWAGANIRELRDGELDDTGD